MNTYQYVVDDFSLENDHLLLNETIFHNANGYLGVRSCFEEGYPENYKTIRGQYINGFYDYASMNQAEKLYGLIEEKQTILNVADTQTIHLYIAGEKFSLFSGEIIKKTRTLDMKKGVTTREIVWRSPLGNEIQITIKRMASFTILPLFLIEYQLKSLNFDADVRLVSHHSGDVSNYYNPDDPRVASDAYQYINIEKAACNKGVSYVLAKTSKSGLHVCSAVKNITIPEVASTVQQDGMSFAEQFDFDLQKNDSVTLYKYQVFCDSLRNHDPQLSAEANMMHALSFSPHELFSKQAAYLDEYWDNCEVAIFGDDDMDRSVHFNLYQLIQSAGKDPFCSVAAKGLSGEGYEGHYFWDVEMYLQPFFTLTAPNIAKSLIRYRFNTLDHAKENARLMGHAKGALYPWRTIMGTECSGYYPSGTAAYHISGDIAFSIIAYYLSTKDIEFVRECGAEIVIETARLWLDTGCYYEGKFHINEVTGPDEYSCLVNNNYFTNLLAQHNLIWATKFISILDENGQGKELRKKLNLTSKELEEFEVAAQKMYLPYNSRLDINPQDDSFLQKKTLNLMEISEEKKPMLLHYHPLFLYRHQVCKQADTVLAHFIFEEAQSINTIHNSFRFYEKVTTHDSSLSKCIFSIVASKLGYEEESRRYFGDSAKLDLFDTHKNTKDGIHTANMGGTYMAIVYGFAGLRIKQSGLYLNPSIPNGWDAYLFNFWFEDAKIRVKINQNECTVELLEGTEKQINIYDDLYILKDKIKISVKQKKRAEIKAIIFDLDGVICHTDHYHYQAWKALADSLDIHFDEQINNKLRGVSRMESLEIILERYRGVPLSESQKNALASKKNDLYRDMLKNMSPADLSGSVHMVLKNLREMGFLLAIGSSSKNARFILDRLGLDGYFDAISDGNNIQQSKPDPEVFLKAAEFLNVNPESCIVVEDAIAGVNAAYRAGMQAITIGDAAEQGAGEYHVREFSELTGILKKIALNCNLQVASQ